jgi:uncharacterized protein (DUF885 family)
MSTLSKLFEDFFDEYIESNPLMATFIGINKYNHIYPNYLLQSEIDKSREFYEKYLNLSNGINTKVLNKKDKHHLEVFVYRIKNELEGFKYHFELLPLEQFDNFILNYVDMASGMSYLPLKTKKDFQNLILKTRDFMEVMDTAICRMREGLSKKLIFSKIIMEKVVEQLEDVIKSKSYLVKKVPESLEKEYSDVLDKQFTERIRKVLIFLKKEYLPKCGDGLEYPGGRDMYIYLVKSHTSLAKPSIPKIHKLGLSEVKRINKEIDELFTNNGMVRPSNDELRNMIYDSKGKIIKEYERIRKLVNTELIPKYFDMKISHDYLLKKVPKFKEEFDAGAYYMMCSIDNKRKGTFYLNMNNLSDHQTFNTLSLSLHEGNPGHHFQLTYANDLSLPNFVTYCSDETGYVEGWGLYSESLAHDFLKDSKKKEDIMFRYGAYNYEIMRACRLVIDTGIHYYGWDFDKCFKFMKENTTFSDNEIEVEIYRYSVYAGQALSYKIGELKFKELREYYTKEKKGSLKDFHKKVLQWGACSLDLLEKMIKK